MPDEESRIEKIAIEDLLIGLENPRYEACHSQREALETIALEQGEKLASLAEDIAENGLNPSDLPLVCPTNQPGKYVVMEGNRRIAALKLLLSPPLLSSLGLPDKLKNQFAEAHAHAQGMVSNTVNCAVIPAGDAKHWVYLRHTGENAGVGIVAWDAIQTRRFRGMTPGLQAIELVSARGYLDEQTKSRIPKIAITNIERVLGTPEAREYLGVEVSGGKLTLGTSEDEALGRLALLVMDVANRQVNVRKLHSRQQRIDYAREVSSRPLPQPAVPGTKGPGAQSGTAGVDKSGAGRRLPPYRTTLIPKRFKVAVGHPRINRIYHELQNLKVEKFTNCSAVMFRVLLELSLDEFAHKHGIQLTAQPRHGQPAGQSVTTGTTRDMTLREKLRTVSDHLLAKNMCTKQELKGVRALISKGDHFLSVDSLNAYVHNKDYNPTHSELTTTWDNVQVLFENIWTL